LTEKPEKPETIDAYIASFPSDTQEVLNRMRALIHARAPEATERMAYGIPTFFLNGNLVHFAGYARHTGLYPGASGIAHFAAELAPYKHAKGSVQFPLSEPLPAALIGRIVEFRLAEQRALAPKAPPKRRPARPV
jgi:uncharacterized protein YdhG (YjbR/CyaY superfamily)